MDHIKEGFKGWTNQEVPAIAFTYIYDAASSQHDANGGRLNGYNNILFSTDDTNMRKNLRTYARNAVAEMNSSTLFGTFRKFNAELAKIIETYPGLDICVGMATIFGCPFEGILPLQKGLDFARRLFEYFRLILFLIVFVTLKTVKL